eukprot:TRINITY_DN66282_c0_g1_i1.p1 TRINITY_DN66282_c0_g1~~TRINITY_DN66282_c0_g1_i1.p1  ORF type:complete len:166 (-),score=38.41 TRINITY_DN66282_c0_g1_i1:106-603(-)
MGCSHSSAKASAPAFCMYLDGPNSNNGFVPSADGKALKVENVQGGPVGLWNNRPHTEKVNKGDVIVKVRKVGAKWVVGDAQRMLESMRSDGLFELQLKRGAGEETGAKAEEAPQAEAVPEPEVQQQSGEPRAPETQESVPLAQVDCVVEDNTEVNKGGCSALSCF